jgi:phosphoglycolate phosphatase
VAPRLVLWDIDGTLVDSGGVGAEVFDLAIERTLGTRPVTRPRMSGKTDPQIVREYLAMLEVAEDDVLVHLDTVLGHLAAALADADEEVRRRGRVLPGVEAALGRLAAVPDVVQTVLTGNVAANAAVKLGAFGLERWLDLEVGAFGSDDGDRNRLVPVALGRVAERRGRRFEAEDVWVVGDSANDLACARASGARCLLVGTGGAAAGALEALGPDAVLPDLSDTEHVVGLLLS